MFTGRQGIFNPKGGSGSEVQCIDSAYAEEGQSVQRSAIREELGKLLRTTPGNRKI
jgi:hypothetical protein